MSDKLEQNTIGFGIDTATKQVYKDLLAATEPDAMPALDWGDLSSALAEWGHSPWSFVATGHSRDLGTMIDDCCDAIAKHQQLWHPETAIVVLRGSDKTLRLQYCKALTNAIQCVVSARTNLWFAAARDPALVDALRVTVVMDGAGPGTRSSHPSPSRNL